jgi:hypothetical protein
VKAAYFELAFTATLNAKLLGADLFTRVQSNQSFGICLGGASCSWSRSVGMNGDSGPQTGYLLQRFHFYPGKYRRSDSTVLLRRTLCPARQNEVSRRKADRSSARRYRRPEAPPAPGHVYCYKSTERIDGTALVLELFGNVMASGIAGVVIASQSGHRLGPLTAEQDVALAVTPADELLALPMLQPDQVKDSPHAYQLSKRGNALRVMAEAVRWGRRGARVNTISPGIIITPLAKDELTEPGGGGYRRMIEGTHGTFITRSDFLMDGGVTAS